MGWDYLKEGQRIGGVKVLLQTGWGSNRYEVRYDVACSVCGAKHEMTHKYILARASKNISGCVSCRTAEATERAKRERRLAEQTHTPVGAIVAGPHMWWTLGPLGPRWGLGHGANQMIGQGASEARI